MSLILTQPITGPSAWKAADLANSDAWVYRLSPEAIDRLYEAFFSTKSEGMGIGLNLCRSIVESHQGRINAENLYNAGQVTGCRFTFWIPVSPIQQPPPPDDAGSKIKAIA